MYRLHIANKNYSSWSLRPWLVLTELGIAFAEQPLIFGDEPAWQAYCKLNPSGLVPCLEHGDTLVWDSLAIVEYLAEAHAGVWPTSKTARAWARSAAAEMHSGFAALRSHCSMNCAVRVRLHAFSAGLQADIQRLDALWQEGLQRFGGPFLAGDTCSAVDAFFAPVVLRWQTYQFPLSEAAACYAKHMLALPSLNQWYQAALAEPFRDEPHEQALLHHGEVVEDLRL